jgi:hypothetical protein
LENFNSEQDEKYFTLINKQKEVFNELQNQGQIEIENFIEKFNSQEVENKPSPEILNQQKILEILVKQKE